MMAFYDSHGWKLWTMYYDSTMTSKDLAYTNSMEKAKAMNEKNDYMTELTATDLLVDDTGKVIGVQAEYYDGTTYEIYGDSVILATGGYIGNAEMTTEYTGYVWNTKGMTQCDGFTIREGLKLGGALYNEDVAVEDHIAQLDTIIRSDDYSNDDKSILTSLVLDLNYQMIDSEGDSFDGNYNGLGIAFNAWEAGANYYVLINEEEYNSIKTEGLISFNRPCSSTRAAPMRRAPRWRTWTTSWPWARKFNDVIIADSLEDLEDKLGFDINLEDVHGQTEGKIYCIKGAAYVYSTCGGLDVDTNMNLLKTDGTAIDNVYVVGNDSLGVLNESNKAYVTYGGCCPGLGPDLRPSGRRQRCGQVRRLIRPDPYPSLSARDCCHPAGGQQPLFCFGPGGGKISCQTAAGLLYWGQLHQTWTVLLHAGHPGRAGGKRETGENPVRSRHCDGGKACQAQRRSHWATGKAAGFGDPAARKPAGHGYRGRTRPGSRGIDRTEGSCTGGFFWLPPMPEEPFLPQERLFCWGHAGLFSPGAAARAPGLWAGCVFPVPFCREALPPPANKEEAP